MRVASILAFLLLTLFFDATAQKSFSNSERFNDGVFKIFWRYLSVKPNTDKAYGGWTVNFAWATNESDQWGTRKRWESTAFSDAIAGVVKKHIMKKPITKSGLDHAFSSGFLGSFQYYKNAVAKEEIIISPGVTLGDYIVAIERYVEGSAKIYDPAGYFLFAGPSLMGSYMINNTRWIDAYVHYEIPYHRLKNTGLLNYVPSEGAYPNPHFLSIGFDIYGKSAFYGGFRFNTLINRGDVEAAMGRLDFTLGIYLK